MTISTAQDVIRTALLAIRVIQANEPIPGPEAADCLDALNLMLDSWNTEGLLTFCDQTQQLVYPVKSPAPGQAYQLTVGPAGDFNCQRPDAIMRAWVIFGSGGSIMPQRLMTQGEFDDIRQKPSAGTYPIYLWYDPQSPLGVLNCWPWPNLAGGNYTQVIRFRSYLGGFSMLTSSVTGLPPGYPEAMVENLAGRIASYFGRGALDALAERKDVETGQPLAGVLKSRLKAVNSVNKAARMGNDVPERAYGQPANILTNTANPPR